MSTQKWLIAVSGACFTAIVVASMMTERTPSAIENKSPNPARDNAPEVASLAPLEEIRNRESLPPHAETVSSDATTFAVVPVPPKALKAERIRKALEDSLYGHIDPNVFLEAALALTDLEVGTEALEPGPIPATRYAIEGTPEGLSAELWVNNTPEGVYASSRSFILNCDLPEKDYIVERAVRDEMRAQVTVWTDLNGDLKNFSIVTDLRVGGMTARLGMPLEDVPTGLMYSYDAERPLDPVCYQLGIPRSGATNRRDSPVTITGRVLSYEKLSMLCSGMHSTH